MSTGRHDAGHDAPRVRHEPAALGSAAAFARVLAVADAPGPAALYVGSRPAHRHVTLVLGRAAQLAGTIATLSVPAARLQYRWCVPSEP
ncbi:hypothetical protein KLP28_16300 [Nocardioidaceae bacterium]|nr:hypothetical protein KLP28_16300 [Nocardioidaceae bacterium]